MERWQGKVALVTGASAGIGAAIAEELVKNGLKVVGMARRVERIEENKQKLLGEKGELFPLKGDVSKTEEVEAAFKFIEEKFGVIHVLINNAGIGRTGMFTERSLEDLTTVINVNLVGLLACTKKALELMKSAGVNDGHIININSIAGHYVPTMPLPIFNVYPASKYGVTGFSESLRQELRFLQSKTKVTSISPGAVTTEIGSDDVAALEGLPQEFLERFSTAPRLDAKDVADSVIFVLQTPPHVQVHELMIRPTGEPF